jgi:chemotaxis protein CheD
MKKPDHVIDIFLQPGDFYFGDRDTRIRTLLGSCISIVMWHPELKIGGMCHYMLSSRGDKNIPVLDGRYGDEAILMFFQEAIRHNSNPNDYIVKIFGGGNMFSRPENNVPCISSPCSEVIQECRNVSCRNIIKGVSLLEQYGFSIKSRDLGGTQSRNIIFDIESGDVWVRKNSPGISTVSQ